MNSCNAGIAEKAGRRLAAAAAFGAALALGGALGGHAVRAARDGGAVAGPVAARVIDVLDGDTILVRARIWIGQEVETRVRLDGVDAPELRGGCAFERRLADAARAFVATAVGGGTVRLSDVRYDKYGGRVLARVTTAEGDDLGALLVAAGLARAYHGGRRGRWCGDGRARAGAD